jgi:nucleoside-diphosphate-sugar epimerase
MNEVLLTGSTGFVGKNLIVYLSKEGHHLQPISLRNGIPAMSLDKKIAIIHLVGKAHDLKNVSDPQEYYQVNFELTKKLYDHFLNSEASKFIFISSVKASADQVEDVLKESDFPDPRTHYGKSKLMAEQYIQAQALPNGKSYYILRPCMIHGPGNKGNLNLLYQFVSKGIPYPLAAFENKRSFLSIENLCFVIREIIERDDIPSGIYNVADDEALSTNELVSLIARESKRSARLWKLSPRLIKALAQLGDKFKLPLTTERLNKLTENYIVSNQKLKDALQKELPISARDGIVKTIQSFQKKTE